MDVNVVVVVYVNTGCPTPLRQRIWLNLRLNSFSRPNARPQGLCGMQRKKRVFALAGNGFTHHRHLFTIGNTRQLSVDI
jgi:hypothetical protein